MRQKANGKCWAHDRISLSLLLLPLSASLSPTICSFSLGIFGLSSPCIVKLHSHRCWRFAPRGKLSSKRKKCQIVVLAGHCMWITSPAPPTASYSHFALLPTSHTCRLWPTGCLGECVWVQLVIVRVPVSCYISLFFFYFRQSVTTFSFSLSLSSSPFYSLSFVVCSFWCWPHSFAHFAVCAHF